jgi:hypothetical protein
MPKDVHILPVSVRLSLGRSFVLTIVHLPSPQKVGNASVAIPGVERKFKISSGRKLSSTTRQNVEINAQNQVVKYRKNLGKCGEKM